MSNQKCLGKLIADARGPYVTFNDAKRQIREAAKAASLRLGTFLPKSESPVLKVPVLSPENDVIGHLTAQRKVGAEILFVVPVSAAEIPAETLQAIMADEAKGRERIMKQ